MALSNHSFCISVMFLQVALQNNSASKIFNTSVSTPRRPHRHNLSRNCSPLQYLQHLTAKRLNAGFSQSWKLSEETQMCSTQEKKNALIAAHVSQLPTYMSFFFPHSTNWNLLQKSSGNRQGPTDLLDLPSHKRTKLSTEPWIVPWSVWSLRNPAKKNRACFTKCVNSINTTRTCKDINLSQDAMGTMGTLLLPQRGKASSLYVEKLCLSPD